MKRRTDTAAMFPKRVFSIAAVLLAYRNLRLMKGPSKMPQSPMAGFRQGPGPLPLDGLAGRFAHFKRVTGVNVMREGSGRLSSFQRNLKMIWRGHRFF